MLNISLVLYKPDWIGEVVPLLRELVRVQCLHKIYLIDNSPADATAEWRAYANSNTGEAWATCIEYRFIGENIGYGRGHNHALRESIYDGVAFHLVMNSDMVVRAEDIDTLCAFMQSEPLVGQVMPRVVYPDGTTQYLCKLLPTPLDVFGRRFLPRRWMARRNARYELRMFGYDRPLNVPYLSGCFMLLRTQAAFEARLFDERYFMYPEDIDLTRTIHRNCLTLYYPAVTVVHNHKQGSYHSLRLLWVHIVNLCRYFNKWGWWYDPERRAFNRQVLSDIAHIENGNA